MTRSQREDLARTVFWLMYLLGTSSLITWLVLS